MIIMCKRQKNRQLRINEIYQKEQEFNTNNWNYVKENPIFHYVRLQLQLCNRIQKRSYLFI